MKRILLLLLLLILPIIQANALIIGTTSDYPPFASLADSNNHFTGFEIDIMHQICMRIKQPCSFKAVQVSTIPKELLTQRIDLAIAAIIIPQTKVSGYIFSLPYMVSNGAFVTAENSNIKTPADIKNKRVGVRRGVLFDGKMFEHFVTKLYKGNVTITDYASNNDVLDALTKHWVDAIFVNANAADYWLLNYATLYDPIGTPIPIGNGYAIMANQGQEPLITKINDALLQMMSDGTYLAIYSRYFTA